jgi:OOP family OmpA-OmpF porin
MKARIAIVATLLGLGVLTTSAPAFAQGFYVGGGFGSTDAGDGNAIPDLITSGSVDGKDSGFKIFGGYSFTPNFAVEMAFVDLGELTYRGTFGGIPVTNGRVETSGLNTSVVGTMPVSSSFSLFAKAGIFAWSAEARDITGGFPFSGSDNGGDLSFGLGGSFHLNRNLSLRAEWESFEANDNITMMSVGLAYRF